MKNHQLDLPCHSSLQRPSDISPLYRLSSDIQSQTLYTSGPTLCLVYSDLVKSVVNTTLWR